LLSISASDNEEELGTHQLVEFIGATVALYSKLLGKDVVFICRKLHHKPENIQ
jgi:hypothetical protein